MSKKGDEDHNDPIPSLKGLLAMETTYTVESLVSSIVLNGFIGQKQTSFTRKGAHKPNIYYTLVYKKDIHDQIIKYINKNQPAAYYIATYSSLQMSKEFPKLSLILKDKQAEVLSLTANNLVTSAFKSGIKKV